jgi:hypothetical protein
MTANLPVSHATCKQAGHEMPGYGCERPDNLKPFQIRGCD